MALKINSLLSGGHRDSKTCLECNTTVTHFRQTVKNGRQIRDAAANACKKSRSPRVCIGDLTTRSDVIVYILHNTKLTVPEICSSAMHPDCMTHLKVPTTKAVVITIYLILI